MVARALKAAAPRLRSASNAAAAIGGMLTLLTVVLAAAAILELRREAVASARTSVENQAFALAAHAEQVLSAAQLLTDNLAQALQAPRRDSTSPGAHWGDRATHDLLRTRTAAYRWIASISLLDRRGLVVSESSNYPARAYDLSAMAAFRLARVDVEANLLVSRPMAASPDGTVSFYLVHRLSDRSGAFAGVILLGLSSDYFSRFYVAQRMDRRAPQTEGAAMTLLRDDLTVLARAPDDPALLGRRLRAANGYAAPAGGYGLAAATADTWDSDPTHRREVLVAMQRVENYPVCVAVALRDTVYLAQWRHQAWSIAGFAIGACLFLALSFHALVRLLRTREFEMREQARLRDAAEQASRAKTQFLATISHEIRTPLNGILGTADLLAHSRLDAQQGEWTHTLLRSGKHLLGVISDMLDLSKIEAGEMTLAPAPVNPRNLAQEVYNLFVGTARGKGLPLVLEVAPDVPLCVEADGTRLRQVLANLLSNAIKFSDAGEVRLALRCASIDPRRCRLHFEVSDHGVGMSPEAQLRVLAPFVQADGSVARRYGGTGLGLTICDRLLSLMGSHLAFESTEGQGSRFWFTLDALRCATGPQDHVAATPAEADRFANSGAAPLDALLPAGGQATAPAPAQALGLHVLTVEDNAVNALVIEAQLASMGCTCEIATDGQAALHALRARHFDAVLMDCMLPLMSGYDATVAWRAEELHTGRPRVPIIALTANVMASNLQRCVACGMDDHLTKPCMRDDLEAMLRKWAR